MEEGKSWEKEFLGIERQKLVEEEKSIKGAIKEYETLFSDDVLTYSLTNTLKTVENLEEELSEYKRKSSYKEKLTQSNDDLVNNTDEKFQRKLTADQHLSFDSSAKFSCLNPDTQSEFEFKAKTKPKLSILNRTDFKGKTMKP